MDKHWKVPDQNDKIENNWSGNVQVMDDSIVY